jgi:ATP-dependent exoDNAse (exonuclease V) beta subunit
LTRAQDVLITYLYPPAKDDEKKTEVEIIQSNNWSKWLNFVKPQLTEMNGVEIINIQLADRKENIGIVDNVAKSNKSPISLQELNYPELPSYPLQISVTEIINKYNQFNIQKKNEPKQHSILAEDDIETGIEFGILCHQILEQLNPFTKDKFAEIMQSHNIKETKILNDSFNILLDSNYANKVNQSQFYHEYPFLTKSNTGVMIEGVIDLYWEDNQGIHIFDLKTHNISADKVQIYGDNLLLQLQIYAWAVNNITGKMPKDVGFYFLIPHKLYLKPITDVDLKTAESIINLVLNSSKNQKPS